MNPLFKASIIIGVFCASFFFQVRFTIQQKTRERERTSDALEALELWTRSRAYPNADIPADRYYRAYLDVMNMRTETDAFSSPPSPWAFIGPTNFSGRTISIAINPLNPNTIYVGAASGGLWRSRTGGLGADWQRVVTGFPVLGVNAVAINPADTNVMYVGTGEVYRYLGSTGGIVIRTTRGSYGMGILKTTNGGTTWSPSLDWTYNQQRGVQTIRFNPQNPRTLFAATSEGVYRTVNAGATWTQVLNILMAEDIAINPADTTYVLATCGNFGSPGTGVYRSTNGGTTFSLVPTLPSYSGKGMLEVYGANPWSVYVSLPDSTIGNGSLYKSTDFGATWTLVSSQAIFGVQGWYSQYVAVHPADSTQVVRGGQNLYKSTNGGISSSSISGPWADHHNYTHHPTNPNILYIVDDGGVWRSTNFGTTYQDVGVGLRTSQFYNGCSNSGSDSLLIAGSVQDHFGYIYRGTLSWENHSSGMDEIGWTAINQTNDQIVYAGNRGGGTISKSTNRGSTFSSSSSGITGGNSSWNAPFVLSKSNPNYLYFGRSIIYKTTNAGSSWTATNGGAALDGNLPLSMAVAPANQDTVFVGNVPGTGRSKIFRTTNGGTSWTNVTGGLPNRYPLDIAIDPTDSRIVYIAFGGFDTTRVAKSIDAGSTWTQMIAPLPNVPATALAIDPFNTNHVYVGTDLGVFVSTDRGSTWASFNDGLPEAVIVGDLMISPSDRSVRLATHSNGVFTRKLLSTVSTGVEEGPPYRPSGFSLDQNFPNPFNPSTTIRFSIPSGRDLDGGGKILSSLPRRQADEFVSLKVFDVQGREMATLVNEKMKPGTYERVFNATALPSGGRRFSSGIYFYQLRAGGFALTKKLLLLK